MKGKRFLGILLTLTMLLSLLPGMSLTAQADSGIPYLDENGAPQAHDAVAVADQTSWDSGWYVVSGSVTISSRINVSGEVHLILADHATLNADAGITVEDGSSLTIYGQSTGSSMGTLNAEAVANEVDYIYPAGIGSYSKAGGSITINGGNIAAIGAFGKYGGGAGIGGCYSPYYMDYFGCRGAMLTINGGNVEAIGGTASPGIGDGPMYAMYREDVHSFSSVTINGGTVTAEGNSVDGVGGGAGIGGGYGGHGVTVTINGGDVTATGGTASAGIGDGSAYPGKYAATITITDGAVTASGGNGGGDENYKHGAGIGGGGNGDETANRGILSFSDSVKIFAGGSPNPTAGVAFDGDFYGWPYFINSHTQQYVIVRGSSVAVWGVKVNAGDNMTKTGDSGNELQADLSGAMKAVVYTANEGYYFPTDYSVASVNGISVTRNSFTQITVSGTPTADAEITLTAPTAKTTPDAPDAAGFTVTDATNAQSQDGAIGGATSAMEYSSDGTTWKAVTGTTISGLNPGNVLIRLAADDTHNASSAVTVAVGNKTLVILQVMSEVSAKTGSEMIYTGNPIRLINTPTTALPDGCTMKYAVTGENTAPTDESYSTSIPTKTDIGTYYVWYKVVDDDNHSDVAPACIQAVIEKPDFGTPDFTMPAALVTIEESAFEGTSLLHVVDARSVTSIGKWAFKDTELTQIRLPANCSIDADAFTGCGTVYVFAPAGSATEEFCADHNGVIFVKLL